MREEFESGIISIPDDPTLIEKLSAFHYKEEDGIIKVESKEELKARGFDSPNKGDCIMMRRFYTPPRCAANETEQQGTNPRRSRRELEDRVKQEKLEMMAKQLVRMRRSAHGLLTTLNQLVPVIDIALQQFDPKCRKCFLDLGLLSECRCTPLKSN